MVLVDTEGQIKYKKDTLHIIERKREKQTNKDGEKNRGEKER